MTMFAVWDHKRQPRFDAGRGRLEVIVQAAVSAEDAAQLYCAGLEDGEERVVCVVDAVALAAAVNAAVSAQEQTVLHLKAEMSVTVKVLPPPLLALKEG